MPNPSSPEILEITFLARAGQGAKTAAQILAEAALAENLSFQAFPEYGPERRGAAVSAYVRLSHEPIQLHSQIDEPDILVALDAKLVEKSEAVSQTTLILNSKEISETDTYTLDASAIANFFLGKNIPNLVMLGSLLAVIKKEFPDYQINLETIKNIIRSKFGAKWGNQLTEKNISSLEKGFEEVARQ